MRVLVMMSGGVDSSVAAALLAEQGHEVVGVTLKLWGGESDSGCCSISDVDDARRVADHLGIDHHTFDFGDAFTEHVVAPYAADHAAGRTPNPCIECNRHIKFAAVDERARVLGFDAVATGHHAQVAVLSDGTRRVARGADLAKDQSYVLHMLHQDQLARTLLPIGGMQKSEVRDLAARSGLRTAAKPDSQDVCFITRTQGRGSFLGQRIPLTPARVVDGRGATVGHVSAVELVTLGQRKGLGLPGGTDPRYVVGIDRGAGTVTVGGPADLVTAEQPVAAWAWAAAPETGEVRVQVSAHGRPHAAVVEADHGRGAVVRWVEPQRRVAPGQSVVAYVGDHVVGGGTAT
jgi:tRNA-specific 2-thiouridylase